MDEVSGARRPARARPVPCATPAPDLILSRGPGHAMRFHTYTKFSPEMADAVDLQSLLDKLADFLLQSGFAGGKNQQPYYGWDFGEDGDRSLEALKQAILNALIESGQFTPEM